MIPRLFVYGTLRRDGRNSMFHMLARDATFAGRARMQGRLYCLGEYPGAVSSRASDSLVAGEVYDLHDPRETLARLDGYEGCGPGNPEPHEFERVETDVILESGTKERVWVYLYRGSVADKLQIESGDYCNQIP